MNSIKLKAESIFHLPFDKYEKDFTFIINSERFETSSFAADLISPLISSRHMIDPTLKLFKINTKTQGDFSTILNLINFKKEEIPSTEVPFIVEILTELGNENIDIEIKEEENNIGNVLQHLLKHQHQPQFFQKQIEKEIEFVSKNFNELKEKIKENLLKEDDNDIEKLSENIIEDILNNQHLQLEKEEDLLEMINQLYLKDRKYSNLYEFVDFNNVDEMSMKKFINIFDFNDLNAGTWHSIILRLQQQIVNDKSTQKKHCLTHRQQILVEIKPKNNEFDGIFKYLQKNSNIKDEINITFSSGNYSPFNLLRYDNNSYFVTSNLPNSWICFEFKNHQIIPTNYTIRSNNGEDHYHLKTWKLEGSEDNEKWVTLDSQNNNNYLKGTLRVHSFPISYESESNKERSFKYIRIQQTGPNWYSNQNQCNYLQMTAIEFYGKLIKNQ